ncbi:uncharacterized protein DUF4194 [Anaerobacterium chartisolvens]|uniref:Uncharacterized protein DUF4194 n=1 Tax=Anaerobacterium chartisolvens TaxID=1297424 RepID=A0A369B1S8_9FIRM|nr:DUF4194 domain-containing protein [Anaerobacterium chartisolvens]RCX14386.1 uncharacterized protein DUF4194 [Anaerobacterium chartisolvens]
MWSETFEALSNYEKGEFRRLANYLLSHTYLVRDVYKPDKQWTEPNGDYRMINRLFECMRDYFYVSGWRLEKDDNYGVISLINEYDHNRLRMDRFTTLFLYTCRLIYEEGREQGDNLHIVRTDTSSIVEKMRTLGLLNKGKTTQKERLEAQRTLSHFNIIQKTETTAWSAEGNGVLIFTSILSIIPNQGINDMMIELEELRTDDADTDAEIEAEEQEDLE